MGNLLLIKNLATLEPTPEEGFGANGHVVKKHSSNRQVDYLAELDHLHFQNYPPIREILTTLKDLRQKYSIDFVWEKTNYFGSWETSELPAERAFFNYYKGECYSNGNFPGGDIYLWNMLQVILAINEILQKPLNAAVPSKVSLFELEHFLRSKKVWAKRHNHLMLQMPILRYLNWVSKK